MTPPQAQAGGPAERDALRVRGVVKHYGSVRANDGIDTEFAPGEVHGLLGENGAGKSTLIKILAGIVRPDAGEVTLGSERLELADPAGSRAAGIAVVHQQSALVPRLTIAENVTLLEGKLGRLGKEAGERLVASAERLGFTLDPRRRVESLTVGDRQRAEIARALMHEARFVILDEPTSVLAPRERADLFELLAQLASSGAGVILVTHRLEEALEETHRVTVLRSGRVTGRAESAGALSEADLIAMMVGSFPAAAPRTGAAERTGEPALKLSGVGGELPNGRRLDRVDLEVYPGEILAVAGVEGNGQSELSAALVGAWKPEVGAATVAGRPLASLDQEERVALIGDIPDDDEDALVPQLSIWENLALHRFSWSAAPTPRERARMRRSAADLVERFDIRTRGIDAPVSGLSGGNRRRALLARELSKEPAVVVATYATKGLDVRSCEQVKGWMRAVAERGGAVVYIGSDLEELLAIADRVAVLVRGSIVGVLDREEATVDRLGGLMLRSQNVEAAA
jgi:general nucleoside transport system ATP-binding protein